MSNVPEPSEPMQTAVTQAWMPAVEVLSSLWCYPVICPGCCRLPLQIHTSGWAPAPPPSICTHQILLVPGNTQSQI